ncbi:MAG: hypothetical protein AB7G75_29965 [Candidatus Binatia bacterium]
MLQEQRKLLHERTGQAVEQLYKDTIEERYSELAHHYQRSGNTKKAVEYLQKAGQQAAQRSANTEAITHLTAALDVLVTQPETRERAAQELTLHLAMGPALMSTLGFAAPAVEQHYTRARALSAQLNDASQRVAVLCGLYLFHLVRGELRTAQAVAEECLQLAEQTHEAELLLEAHALVGDIFYWRGEFVRARVANEQSRAFYHSQNQALPSLHNGLDPRVLSLGNAARALWYLGYPEQSRTRIDEALHLAQELAHPFHHALSLFIAADLYGERGDGRLAQEYADAEATVSREHGFPHFLASGTVHQGKMLMTRGQWAEGVSQVKQGLEVLEGELQKTRFLAWLARGYGEAGQVEDGLTTVAEALRLVEKNDDRHYEAELYRLKGELTLQSKTSLGQVEDKSQTSRSPSEVEKEAEQCFVKAIEIAQKQQAKSLELRATMSLVRLRQQQATQSESRNTDHASRATLDEARRMLSEVYNWFTEGFDTKDLQEAKALLNVNT